MWAISEALLELAEKYFGAARGRRLVLSEHLFEAHSCLEAPLSLLENNKPTFAKIVFPEVGAWWCPCHLLVLYVLRQVGLPFATVIVVRGSGDNPEYATSTRETKLSLHSLLYSSLDVFSSDGFREIVKLL